MNNTINNEQIENIDNINTTPNINTSPNVNNIDTILNDNLLSFENKNQRAMFFVAHKSLRIIDELLHSKYKITIPHECLVQAITTIIPNIIKEYNCNIKKRYKKTIPREIICLGRKLDNNQCSRKKHDNTDLCKSHLRKLSNGRIDQPSKVIVKSKRGRKRKVQFDPRQYDNEYITLWEDIIEGYKVLVDNNNNIYSFDIAKPVFLGKKDINFKLSAKHLKIIQQALINDIQQPVVINDIQQPVVINNIQQPDVIHNIQQPVVINNIQQPVVINNDIQQPVVINNDIQQLINDIQNIDINKLSI